jgi:hypothetical protein
VEVQVLSFARINLLAGTVGVVNPDEPEDVDHFGIGAAEGGLTLLLPGEVAPVAERGEERHQRVEGSQAHPAGSAAADYPFIADMVAIGAVLELGHQSDANVVTARHLVTSTHL